MCLSKLVNKGPASTHSFSHTWLLSTYYVQEHAPGVGSTVMNKTEFQWHSHSVEENALETTNYRINCSITIVVSCTKMSIRTYSVEK